jgi:carboxypeptidase Q
MRLISSVVAHSAILILALPTGAQELIDQAAIDRIKQEGVRRSQVMETASWLTDVYGPRLTNSPIARQAGEWSVNRMKEWGLTNPHLEWFDFGRGWINERNVAQVVAPVPYPVHVFPGAWTTGTNGPVTGDVVIVELPQSAADADYAKYRGTLRGKIVLASSLPDVNPMFTAPGRRFTVAQLDSIAATQPQAQGGGGRAGGPPPQQQQQGPSPAEIRNKFWVDEGVIAVLTPGTARGNSGSVSNGPTGNRQPNAAPSVPQLAVAAEHYGRMYRQVQKRIAVRLELDIRNRFTNELQAFNVVADIPGSDSRLKDEVVMIGAHFDSWHNATGATDNAGSSAVMMEAMRILKASGVSLKRTVRIGLWTGEEQGLIGSRNYVETHFGTAEQPKPGHAKLAAYFNQDNGGGAIRGVWAQGNSAVVPIFREWLKVLDSDSITVRHLTMLNTGSTDHVSFDRAGLPGFQFIQDPMEYGTRTHHSSQDFFERLVPSDMRHNAVAVAVFAYLAANRDQPLPRKSTAVQ